MLYLALIHNPLMKKQVRLSFRKLTLLLCSFFAVSFTSCIDGYDADVPAPRSVTFLAIYHGAPNAPDVDIFFDNTRINNQGFKYADYSNYFDFITPGNHRLKSTPVNASNAYIDTALTFQENKVYSLFVVDQLQNIDLLVVKDRLVVPATNEVGLRILHLSPDAPAVDVVSSKSSSTPLFTNLDFKKDTLFRKVATGIQTIQVKRAGTGEVLLNVPNISLDPGRVYTFIIRGFTTPPAGISNVLSMQVIRNY